MQRMVSCFSRGIFRNRKIVPGHWIRENYWGPKRTLRVRMAAQYFALKAREAACCGASLWGVPLSAPRVLFHGDNQRIAIHVELIWTQAVIDFNDLAAAKFHVRDDIAEAVIPHVFEELLYCEAECSNCFHLIAAAFGADALLGTGFPCLSRQAVHEAVPVIDEVIDAADWRRNQPGTPIFRIGRPGPGEPFWLPFAGKPIAIV